MRKDKLYLTWLGMKSRCYHKDGTCYKNYGGRGIRICKQWMHFESFAEWSRQNGFQEGLSIDRIDNDGHYTPDNCRWTDTITQNHNRRNSIWVNYYGDRMTLLEVANLTGLTYTMLWRRRRDGWSDIELVEGRRG